MIIRPATPDDALAIARVEVTTWQIAYRDIMPHAFLRALSVESQTQQWRSNLIKHGVGGQKRVLIAHDGADIIGFVRVGTVQEHHPIGLIFLLYVLPTFWKHGVGTALMQGAMYELRDLGHDIATLWVLQDNARARCFYERLGWQHDGRTTVDDYGGVSLQALCYQRNVEILAEVKHA